MRPVASPLLFMAMELCWIAGLLLALGAHFADGDMGAVLPAAALYPAAYGAARMAAGAGLAPRRLRLAAMLLGPAAAGALALALVSLPDGQEAQTLSDVLASPALVLLAIVLVAGGFAWTRGWSLARRGVDAAGFATGFQVGLAALIAMLLFAPAAPAAPVVAAGFVALALVGLWRARANAPGFGDVAFAAFGLLAVAVLSLALWAAVDRSVLEATLAGLQWGMRQIGRLFEFLGGMLPDGGTLTPPATAPTGAPPVADRPFSLSEAFRTVAKVLFALTGGTLIGIAVFRGMGDLLRWLRQREGRDEDIRRTRSAAGWTDMLKALLRWFRYGWGWLAGTATHALGDQVRRRYRDLLHRLARRGRPRHAHETPDEYCARLAPGWPRGTVDLADMTAAYVAARYGRDTPPDAHAIDAIWRRLRGDVRKVK